jgi:Tfp pilus assembly protein PilV
VLHSKEAGTNIAMRLSRGFSLVETVVAIALLTGTLVMLAQLVAAGVSATAAAQYRTVATILAQQKMEELRGEAILDDDAGSIEHRDGAGVKVCATDVPCDAAVFSLRWSIVPAASTADAVLIQISAAHAHRNYGLVRAFAIRLRRVR